jgi:hypothetical protein
MITLDTCYYLIISYLSLYHLIFPCYHAHVITLMLSSLVIITYFYFRLPFPCYPSKVIIRCYHPMLSFKVIIPILSSMLSFQMITASIFIILDNLSHSIRKGNHNCNVLSLQDCNLSTLLIKN